MPTHSLKRKHLLPLLALLRIPNYICH